MPVTSSGVVVLPVRARVVEPDEPELDPDDVVPSEVPDPVSVPVSEPSEGWPSVVVAKVIGRRTSSTAVLRETAKVEMAQATTRQSVFSNTARTFSDVVKSPGSLAFWCSLVTVEVWA